MRFWLTCVTVWVALAPRPATAPREPTVSAHVGSREMVAYLDRIASTADPVVNVYMNRARAAGISTLLRQELAPAQELQLRVKIATELLQGGQTQEAIKQV